MKNYKNSSNRGVAWSEGIIGYEELQKLIEQGCSKMKHPNVVLAIYNRDMSGARKANNAERVLVQDIVARLECSTPCWQRTVRQAREFDEICRLAEQGDL